MVLELRRYRAWLVFVLIAAAILLMVLVGVPLAALVVLAASPLAVLAQGEGGEASKPNLFELNAGLSVWIWLVFGILVFLLGRYAWKPILGALEAREKGIQDALDEAAARNAEAADLREEHRQQLADARRQATRAEAP